MGVVNHVFDRRGSQFYDFTEQIFTSQFLRQKFLETYQTFTKLWRCVPIGPTKHTPSPTQNCAIHLVGGVCRGRSRIFLRRGAGCTSKEWRHWRWGKQILKANNKKKASSQGVGGGGGHPLYPCPRSAPGMDICGTAYWERKPHQL